MSIPKTPAELLALVEAGTPGEWSEGQTSISGESTIRIGKNSRGWPEREVQLPSVDVRSIVALHNLSRKLAALWAAAEVLHGLSAPEDGLTEEEQEARETACSDAWQALHRALADLNQGAKPPERK